MKDSTIGLIIVAIVVFWISSCEPKSDNSLNINTKKTKQIKLDINKQLHLKKSTLGCITEASFSQFNTALIRKDNNLIKDLLDKKKCLSTNSKFKVSMIKPKITMSLVKIYTKNGSINLWVSNEFLSNN